MLNKQFDTSKLQVKKARRRFYSDNNIVGFVNGLVNKSKPNKNSDENLDY